MVDARGFDTCMVKMRCKADLDMLLERMDDDEGLVLTKDLTFDYEFLEEGRSLSLCGKEAMRSKTEWLQHIDTHHELLEDGTYKPHVDLAFFAMDSVATAVQNLAVVMGKNMVEREKKEFQTKTMKEAGIGKDECFGYKIPTRDWVVPETTNESDNRGSIDRFVSGGTPKALGTTEATAVASKAPPIKKITKYSTGEPDAVKLNTKVYIEQAEVVNVDEGRIKVDFKQTSYTVRVDTLDATYVLGPLECGHIIPSLCSWRLSKGKRITITLQKSKPVDPMEAALRQQKEAGGMESWQVFGIFFAIVFAVLMLSVVGGGGGR